MSIQMLEDKELQASILLSILELINQRTDGRVKEPRLLPTRLKNACMRVTNKNFPLPYGLYISLAYELCKHSILDDNSELAAAVLLSISCSSPDDIRDHDTYFSEIVDSLSDTEDRDTFLDNVFQTIYRINKEINIKHGFHIGE